MALKRKRSPDESPLSISSYTGSTPDAQSPTPLPDQYDGAMELDMPRSFDLWARRKGGVEGSSLGCRTRKRVRDNRPDERVIHGKPLMCYALPPSGCLVWTNWTCTHTISENTIHKLFAAQRQNPHAEPILSESSPPPSPNPSKPIQKSTLHSFWNLPALAVQPPTIHITAPHQVAPQTGFAAWCEDCDAPLREEAGGMDTDVDMDGGAGENSVFACIDCGKHVCGTCAVVSNARHCLRCATTSRGA
jgi:hypothetical protein